MADPRLGADDELQDSEHVVRYCSKGTLRQSDGTPGPTAFFPDSDGYLSVYWLEFAQIEDETERWADMRLRMAGSGLTLRVSGKLAELPVGAVKIGALDRLGRALRVRHMPVLEEDPQPDESHCGIHGLPLGEDLDAAEFLASMVSDTAPGKL